MRLSIIIPTYNNLSYLKYFLLSLKKNSAFEHEIILHINEGSDGTLNYAINNNIKYTYSNTNIGLCSSMNRAYSLTTTNHILYAHDDMFFCKDWDIHLSNEVKKHFLEVISTYKSFDEQMKRKSDIVEVAETLGGIVEASKALLLGESDDWFDKVTIKRNLSELEKMDKSFEKIASEARQMDERLGALYEDMGNILNRYYEMADLDIEEANRRLGKK